MVHEEAGTTGETRDGKSSGNIHAGVKTTDLGCKWGYVAGKASKILYGPLQILNTFRGRIASVFDASAHNNSGLAAIRYGTIR